MATVVAELAQRNAITEGRVRLSLSARDLHYQEPLIQSSLSITIDPYVRPVTPVHLVTAAAAAFGCPLAQHKSTSYASYILARQYALSQGATDTLMRNAQGDIIEGATCNVFFARGGQWATPDLQTYGLPGIQRGVVLARLGESHGGCDVQCDQDWQTWEHAVVTNSLIGTLPVASINGEPLPLPGEEFVAHLCAPQTRYPC